MAKQSLLALKSAMNFPVDEDLKILIKEEDVYKRQVLLPQAFLLFGELIYLLTSAIWICI